ncbi:hypothetical protein CC79DRAFT_1335012 [Sarocladium strictum]
MGQGVIYKKIEDGSISSRLPAGTPLGRRSVEKTSGKHGEQGIRNKEPGSGRGTIVRSQVLVALLQTHSPAGCSCLRGRVALNPAGVVCGGVVLVADDNADPTWVAGLVEDKLGGGERQQVKTLLALRTWQDHLAVWFIVQRLRNGLITAGATSVPSTLWLLRGPDGC